MSSKRRESVGGEREIVAVHVERLQFKRRGFVLMPFDPKFDDLYEFGVKGAMDKARFRCERLDEIPFSGGILQKITERIAQADVVIGLVTGHNPNVLLEIGMA